RAGRAARQVVLLAPDLREGGQRVLHGRVGPLDLVRGELVVLLRAGLGEVDVLEPVGQRPAVRPADRERGDAGVVHRLRGGEEFVPGLGLVGARVLEDLGVVPDQRLVGGLVVDAVLLAVDSAPSGFAHFFSTACLTAPGCGSIATSGGAPPAIFEPRKLMIGSWAGTKVTSAPVRFSNSARTFLKLACSAPVHTAATSR